MSASDQGRDESPGPFFCLGHGFPGEKIFYGANSLLTKWFTYCKLLLDYKQ